MDEAEFREGLLELDPQLSHVDVDRTVTRPKLPAPHPLVEHLAAHDPAAMAGQGDEQLELADRQRDGPSTRDEQAVVRADLQGADVDDVFHADRRLHGSEDFALRAPTRLSSC